jgi:hypothetical protein
MKRKLERDTSTPERRAWWNAVMAAAANAPRLVIRESKPVSRAQSGDSQRTKRKQPVPPRSR